MADDESFHIVSDRRATALDLEAFEWNPTMDLLACLTAPPDSTLSVYRLLSEDQSPKLLSEKVVGIGTSLAWSPCGRKLAVGDKLGGVSIYDGESGVVLHKKRTHTRAVVAISWSSADRGETTADQEQLVTGNLPPLLTIPSALSNMFSETVEASVVEKGAGGSESFTLIASVDEGGVAVVSSGGTFPLLAVRVFGAGETDAAILPLAGGMDANLSDPSRAPAPAHFIAPLGLLDLPYKRCSGVQLSPDLRQLAVLLESGVPLQSRECHRKPGQPSPVRSSTASPAITTPPRQGQQPSPSLGTPAVTATAAAPDSGASIITGGKTIASTPLSAGTQHHRVAGMQQGLKAALEPTDVAVVVLDVRNLAVRRRELVHTAWVMEHLVAVVSYAKNGLDTMRNVWRSSSQGLVGKLHGLVESIEQQQQRHQSNQVHEKDSKSAHVDLLAMMCTGIPSEGLRSFLQTQTSPQQLVRLSRLLEQALEYINVLVSTRLQVAAKHILTLVDDLSSHASWDKFRVCGLPGSLLGLLADSAHDLLRILEMLLTDCHQTRMFSRVLLYVLWQAAQRLAEQPQTPTAGEAGMVAPSSEDIQSFIEALKERRPLDLRNITNRFGASKPVKEERAEEEEGRLDKENLRKVLLPAVALVNGDKEKTCEPHQSMEAKSMTLEDVICKADSQVQELASAFLCALSSRVQLLTCLRLTVSPPWGLVSSVELQKIAAAEVAASPLTSIRNLLSSRLTLRWESSLTPLGGCRLLLLYSPAATGDSDRREADLQLLRIWLRPSRPSHPPKPEVSLLRLSAASVLASSLPQVPLSSHFMMGELYDDSRIIALALHEGGGGGAGQEGGAPLSPVLCLMDISEVDTAFQPAIGLATSEEQPGFYSLMEPQPTNAAKLPWGCLKRRRLDESYTWASAMRAMCTRGVCSIYAWRTRRMLTLDLEADDDNEGDGG